MPLYPHQSETLSQYHRAKALGVRRVLLVAPTGAGKTRMAQEIARAHRGPVLFLAPWRVLIPQTAEAFTQDAFPDDQVAILMSGRKPRLDRPVQVGSIETVRQWLDKLELRPGLVVVDEAHRANTKLRQALLEEFADADHLLLTATPFNRAGGGLRDIADELITVASVRDLITGGYLCSYRHFVGDPKTTDAVPVIEHEFDEEELARRLRNPRIMGDVVESWTEHAQGRPTLCFAVNRDHSHDLTRRFTDAGVAAEHLDGDTAAGERNAILERLESGETQVVCNCNVLVEGFDQRSISCVILKPTRSLVSYIQQAGRGLRIHDSKTDCVLLDPGGNALRFGLVDQDRGFTLDGLVLAEELEDQVVDDGLPPIPLEDTPVPCVVCSALSPASVRKCPACGWYDARPTRLPPRVEGDLLEVQAEDFDEDPAGELRRLLAAGRATGYGLYWAATEYAAKHGALPPTPSVRRRIVRELEEQALLRDEGPEWVRARLRDIYG